MKKFDFKNNKLTVILIAVAAVLVLLVGGLLIFIGTAQEEPVETVPPTVPATQAPTEPATEAPTETVPVETEPVMLAHMAELYAKNPDVAGWVRIDDTKIDYPIVYTPEDQNKYLHMNIDGLYSYAGEIIMDMRCTVEPESSNIILHGHNMNNGTMFNSIMLYEKKEYWEEHPIIYYSNLYEEREYIVIAAYRDKVYWPNEDVFKFYEFTNPATEEEFNEGMDYIMERVPYETGLTAEFGDRLLMLVTCAYHTDNGRFIVVAREVNSDASKTPTATP